MQSECCCFCLNTGLILYGGNQGNCLHAPWSLPWCPWNNTVHIYNFLIGCRLPRRNYLGAPFQKHTGLSQYQSCVLALIQFLHRMFVSCFMIDSESLGGFGGWGRLTVGNLNTIIMTNVKVLVNKLRHRLCLIFILGKELTDNLTVHTRINRIIYF